MGQIITIDDFFKHNGIVKRSLSEATDEHRRISRIEQDSAFYPQYFNSGLDDFFESVNHDENKELFTAVAEVLKGKSDIVEPCCQSGLFGAYIALQGIAEYQGFDISKEGIIKAKARAEHNNLNPERFNIASLADYPIKHEVVTGRYVANSKYGTVQPRTVRKISEMADTAVMIQNYPAGHLRERDMYIAQFKDKGYNKIDIIKDGVNLPATGDDVFAFIAKK